MCTLEKKMKYYTELINTITTFNEKNKSPLFIVNIWEPILKFMREDEEELITDANNVTADVLSHEFCSQKENMSPIFTS